MRIPTDYLYKEQMTKRILGWMKQDEKLFKALLKKYKNEKEKTSLD